MSDYERFFDAKLEERAQRLAIERDVLRSIHQKIQAESEAELPLLRLREERNKQQLGVGPEALWGERAGALCNEFVRFVVSKSVALEQPVGSVALTSPEVQKVPTAKTGLFGREKKGMKKQTAKIEEAFVGYPVAYANPVDITDTTRQSRHGPFTPGRSPQKDVFLCMDGKIRRSGGLPIDVVDINSTLLVPEFGHYHSRISNQEVVSDITIDGSATYDFSYTSISTRHTFQKFEATRGLEKVLSQIVLDNFA